MGALLTQMSTNILSFTITQTYQMIEPSQGGSSRRGGSQHSSFSSGSKAETLTSSPALLHKRHLLDCQRGKRFSSTFIFRKNEATTQPEEQTREGHKSSWELLSNRQPQRILFSTSFKTFFCLYCMNMRNLSGTHEEPGRNLGGTWEVSYLY